MPYTNRLGELDLADRLSARVPRLVTQVVFGLVCTLAMIVTRWVIDQFAPIAGPFSIIYPAILIATLFGRWRAGLVCLVTSFAYAWYYVLPETGSFAFANAEDQARTIVNGVSSSVIVIFAEVFRRAVRRAVAERRAEVEARDLLLREIDHRMKNNFAMVTSLIDIQRRREKDEYVKEVLGRISTRVHNFAAAHNELYAGARTGDTVDMNVYLSNLVRHLENALFSSDRVSMNFRGVTVRLPRDRAVAVGVVVNELVTNAAKHAFPEQRRGSIDVELNGDDDHWVLIVSDDGAGYVVPDGAESGLGSVLIPAFARSARATFRRETPEIGTRIILVADDGEDVSDEDE